MVKNIASSTLTELHHSCFACASTLLTRTVICAGQSVSGQRTIQFGESGLLPSLLIARSKVGRISKLHCHCIFVCFDYFCVSIYLFVIFFGQVGLQWRFFSRFIWCPALYSCRKATSRWKSLFETWKATLNKKKLFI